jgi:tetratricopeptide (TPR) repeat protein
MRRLILISVFSLSAALGAPCAQAHLEKPDAKPFGGGESNSDYFMRMSDEAFHAGDYDRAVLLHKARVAIDPEAVDSFGIAAWLLWSQGKGGEAVAFIDRGLELNPNDWNMWDEAGQHFDLQKKFDRSAQSYKRAVELVPADEPSQMLRRRYAHAAEKSGDLATSANVWRALVKDYPDQAVNKNNLMRVENLQKAKN